MGLEKELKKIVAEVSGVSLSAVKDTVNLQRDLGIDSFNAVEILVAVEQKYGITIDRARAFEVRTFRHIVKLAKEYLQKK